jgi:hypothetical protein
VSGKIREPQREAEPTQDEAHELLEDADDAREAREALAWLEAGEQPVPAAQVWAELGLEPGQ